MSGSESQIFAALIANMGAVGFLFWMFYRLNNFTIPKLISRHDAESERQRMDFREMLQQQNAFFASQMEREREVHGQHIDRIIEELKEIRREHVA